MLRLAGGAICGIAAGIVTGIGARFAMRMVADGVPDRIGQNPSFTAEGTATIIFLGALAGAPFGALFAAIYDALPRPRRARGVLFGVAMLVTIGPLFFTGTPDEFISRERMVLFAFLFPLFGTAAGLLLEPSLRLAQRLPGAAQAVFVLIAFGGGSLVATGIFALVGQAVETNGALAIAYVVPWLAVGVLFGLALRSRISPAQLVRSPD
jgi:hypothetical protein